MNKRVNILVVDDESLARKRVLKLLHETELDLDLTEATSGKEAITKINAMIPDIVFLDIQMTDMTGFDVLKNINSEHSPIIIFVTAFDNFAVKAFEVQAIDFLLKPYKKERFIDALYRALNQLEVNQKKEFKNKLTNLISYVENEPSSFQASKYLSKLVLKLQKRYYFVEVHAIKYITSSAYYAEIFTLDDKKHIYRISMSDFIEKLDPNAFIRINRSTIISLSYIKEVISEGAGDFSIIMKDNTSFALTKIYKGAFLKKVNIKND